jgi:PAS domain S-box-containing protein
MQTFLRKSIKARIFLAILLPLVLVEAGLLYFYLDHINEDFRSRYENIALTISSPFIGSIEKKLETLSRLEDKQGFLEVYANLKGSIEFSLWIDQYEHLTDVAFVDDTGKHLAATSDIDSFAGVTFDWDDIEVSSVRNDVFFAVSVPLRSAKHSLAHLLFRFSDQEVVDEEQEALLLVGLTLALSLLFGSALAWIISSAITRPINLLASDSERLATGDIDHEISDLKLSDEIGLLAKNFRLMRDSIHEKLKALGESEERFRQIFAANPDPVILATLEDGAIIDVNRSFETTTGITRFEAIGHNYDDLGLWADDGMRGPFRELIINNDGIDNFETDFRVTDGQIRTGLLSARILKINNELYILIVIRDITAEKTAEKTMIEMDQMKSEFISTAAHELNTPLSAMLGFTELLLSTKKDGDFGEEQRLDFLNEIYDRGEALSHIIDDLLDISRIESGHTIALNLQETNFSELLIKIVEYHQHIDSGHILRLDLPEESEPTLLKIDRHRINQVIENLLSNAVKYSPEGKEIVLQGRIGPEGWEVRIIDQGIGMTQEQVDRVFDKFYRADASNTAIGGLGLGMSIVKQIVEVHGGSIRVESAEEKGTTVIFNLPYPTE